MREQLCIHVYIHVLHTYMGLDSHFSHTFAVGKLSEFKSLFQMNPFLLLKLKKFSLSYRRMPRADPSSERYLPVKQRPDIGGVLLPARSHLGWKS